MIMGMGAVGLVLEREDCVLDRGMAPLARLLATRIANSAFHGTRLDPPHIAGEMDALIGEAVEVAGTDRASFAGSSLFMSHETYTPARGGSAAAEIESIRTAFGDMASKVVVTNTKGFTGHAMGAGIEDAIAIKALQYGTVPPVPNLKEPDPDLGDLTLSQGGKYDVRYAIRLAAGFGSQLALAAWERIAQGDERIHDAARHTAWLCEVSGIENGEIVVEKRTLRLIAPKVAKSAPVTPAPEVAKPVPVVPAPEVAAAVPVPVPTPTAAVPAADVLAHLLGVIAEKTGYDIDELDPEYELEADLGVDTVKQAEIFGEVREHYGFERDDEFSLADYPTIESLAGWMAAQVAGIAAAPAVAAPAVAAPAEAAPAEAPAPAVAAPEVVEEAAPLEDGFDAAPTAAAPSEASPLTKLPESFRIRRPFLVAQPLVVDDELGGLVVRVVGAGLLADALTKEIERRGGKRVGKPDLVIDLSHEVREGFHAAKEMGEGQHPYRWVCVTRLGADAAWVELAQGMTHGARAGLAKALGREWEECHAKVVDIAPEIEDGRAASMICDEICSDDRAVEVFRDAKIRRVIALGVDPFPKQGGTLEGNPLIVLTGGTRGITAEVAVAFAARFPCRLALLARTAPGTEPLDEAAQKAAIRSRLEGAGERATPVKIEQRLRRLRAAEEARQNMERMRALGAEVSFFQVDLATEDGVAHALEQVRKAHGHIDGVVHGAGVEESRLISDKDDEAFSRVFDGKAIGGLALAQQVDAGAWFVSMGSVAGRFGNAGQVDYSAANEAMARVCLSRARSLHVGWTAWGDVGMAVRGGMEKLLGSRGVEMLPADAGSNLVVDMVTGGMTGEVIVSGRLGDFSLEPDHPLLDRVDMEGDGIRAFRTLSLDTDGWIQDHAIDGIPVLPGVVGIELMAATAVMAKPGTRYVGARDVIFASPVKMHRGEPVELIIEAQPGEGPEVHCTVSSRRKLRTGRVQETQHFEATMLVDLPGIFGDTRAMQPLPAAFFADEPLDKGAIYQRFFHGPIFQVLTEAEAMAHEGMLGTAQVDHDRIGTGLLTAPLVLESAFQAAGLHRMALDGLMALPASIEKVVLGRQAIDGEPLQVMVRRRGDLFDVDVDGPEGTVLRLRGFKMIDTGPLPDGDRFPVPEDGWPSAVLGFAATPTNGKPDQAQSLLIEAEWAEIQARGTDKRQRDRAAGKAAAKVAVRALTGMGGDTFSILRTEGGRPAVTCADGRAGPAVTIAHKDGEGFAAAVCLGLPGLDVEDISHRHVSFAASWFTDGERALSRGDARRETQIWAAKEAVLKALGTGMALDPRQVEIVALHPRRAEVKLWGEVAVRRDALGATGLFVSLGTWGERVVAAALLTGQGCDPARIVAVDEAAA
jgi:NAD(P)-dependent dehydrogenase (short-subunit alcohol dehydrogenase family)/phosphopantetheinyl transferase/acyl carrier protein